MQERIYVWISARALPTAPRPHPDTFLRWEPREILEVIPAKNTKKPRDQSPRRQPPNSRNESGFGWLRATSRPPAQASADGNVAGKPRGVGEQGEK